MPTVVGNENHWDLIFLRTGLAAFSLSITDDWMLTRYQTRDPELAKKEERRRRWTIIICFSSTMCLGSGLTPQGDLGVADNLFQDTR